MKEFFWVEEIASGACISLKNMRGWRIECETGQVWVTEAGLAQDVFIAELGALGQPSYEIQRQAHVVIQAMPISDAVAQLRIYPPASLVQRLRRHIAQHAPARASHLPSYRLHSLSNCD